MHCYYLNDFLQSSKTYAQTVQGTTCVFHEKPTPAIDTPKNILPTLRKTGPKNRLNVTKLAPATSVVTLGYN
jgi:hypothetical protein